MKFFWSLICLLPLNLWAVTAWQVEVGLGIDGQTWKIEHQKFEEGKESTLNIGNYALKMTLTPSKQEKGLDIIYALHEKKGKESTLVSKGEDTVEEKRKNDIYLKGEPNQPNAIVTIKLKHL